MIRLTLLLCAGLFSAMAIGGRDTGQVRFGLMPQPPSGSTAVATFVDPAPVANEVEAVAPKMASAPARIAPEAENSMVVNASFAPAKPVMVAPVAVEADVVNVADNSADMAGRVLRVTAKSVNVRSGPGTDYSVMDRLRRGDEVLVVDQGDGPDGWSMIRIEGDGVEGYIASRLLSE